MKIISVGTFSSKKEAKEYMQKYYPEAIDVHYSRNSVIFKLPPNTFLRTGG